MRPAVEAGAFTEGDKSLHSVKSQNPVIWQGNQQSTYLDADI